ncbi:MAG: hypothetical protein HKO84_06290 [Pseudomonadales bacterium]|nr:hypothetical protein [Pseudomonadales bacterium]
MLLFVVGCQSTGSLQTMAPGAASGSGNSATAAAAVAETGIATAPASNSEADLPDDPFPGFKRLFIRGGGILYVRDGMDFESYDSWFLDEAGIEFNKQQIPLTAKEQAQLKMLMFRARVQQTKYYGNVVKEPTACTLTQQLHMKKLLLYKSPTGGPMVNFISSFGKAVVVAEIKDSLTGELVFAYIEPVRLGRGVTKSASPDMDRLAAALTEAMERAHRALVEQLPVDPDKLDDRASYGCNGQIGRNVLEIRKVLHNSSAN